MLSPAQTTDVPLAFDEAAATYDLMVKFNPGYHQHLRSAARALLERLPSGPRPLRLADLGCGSGASTRALVEAAAEREQLVDVVGVDASGQMLAHAEQKSWPAGVHFVHGRAEDLHRSRADWGLAEPHHGVFAAYLFRNVTERDAVLHAVHDLLAPGGVLVTQEYSVTGSRHAPALWTAVCWLVVIPLAWLTSRRTTLYRYLWRSVRTFDSVQEFTDRLHAAGFVEVEVRTVPGWQRDILHTVRARRPQVSA
ncbi:MAG TPA: class I SAM-dependent methyltransferase [Propionibacteriaceae bacterium]|nr:class I SAM-dependent methyltransferase [Propionibacteriaceae bacterium]